MKNIYLPVLFCFTFSIAFAQSVKTYRNTGDRAFSEKNYYEAAYYYGRALGERKQLRPELEIPFHSSFRKPGKLNPADSAYFLYQLAESYRLFEDYKDSGIHYKRLLDAKYDELYPLARLWYGICLRAQAQFDAAITQLVQFRSSYTGEADYTAIADRELANCRFAKEQYQHPPWFDVSRLDGAVNTGAGNYALSYFGAGILFTSSRIADDDRKNINRIYFTALHDTSAPKMVSFGSTIKTPYKEFGTPSADATGKRIYFTAWYRQGDKIITKVCLSERKGNEWSAPQELNAQVNEEGYNSKQPFITSDGKKLFFASDKPGGMGGDDIWVSDLGDDGQPLNSTNLGNTVNTSSDEQSPYYDPRQKRLVYGSKGFVGFGGFDLYESRGSGTSWSPPQNMGYPLNSPKDDLYYLQDKDDLNRFYFSSDRESDCCFSIFEGKIKVFTLAGQVIDCGTQLPVPGVKVTLTDTLSGQTIETVITGSDGKYKFTTKAGLAGKLSIEKEGYGIKTAGLSKEMVVRKDTIFNPDICLTASRPKETIAIKNIQFDFNSYSLTQIAKTSLDTLVTVLNSDTGAKLNIDAHTDAIGGEDYNIKLSEGRARSCVDYLVSKGIAPNRLTSKGYGKSRPLVPNTLPNGQDDPNGRQVNRRVEFTIIEPVKN
jgi:OmpA-OmpF porin, OOP family